MGGNLMLLVLFDLLLLLLGTLRFTRLVTTDNLPGQWWIYGPLYKAAYGHPRRGVPKWGKYLEGLTCPFCVGFWIGLVVLAALVLAGGPGDAALWWRYGVGAFALNWVVGHVASRLD